MCGITAIVALDQLKGRDLDAAYRNRTRTELYQSLEKLQHRGPDSEHVWISDDNRIALAQNRLAINDLTPDGEQPFHDAQNSVHVIVNGEIYMSDEDRAALEPWHTFKGHSDCEVIIPLYLKYGVSFLSKLRGEFALVLYDSRRQLVIAARDRFGIKPLFWTVAEGRLLISSEAKGFLPLGWKPEWDVKSLLDDGWVYGERTIFKGVRKILPAYYMTCLSFDYIQQQQYWDIDYPDKTISDTRTEEEMVLAVREKLREAVRVRLRADVPVGIYLSGGLDSSTVAGIAVSILEEECEKTGRNINEAKKLLKCFCIGFDEDTPFDETAIAKRTADHLGLEFQTTRMDDALFATGFVKAAYHTEHHMPDLNHIGKFLLSDLARKAGYKTILTGEGSDEHFGGYTLFYPDLLREKDLTFPSAPANALPDEARAAIVSRVENGVRGVFKQFGISRLDLIGSDGLTSPSSPACDPRSLWRRQLNNISFPSHVLPMTCADFAEWTKCYGHWDPRETTARGQDARILSQIQDKWHPFNATNYVWAKSGLPNTLLTALGDRTEMGHSIEGRPPFLDHHLAEFCNNLPPSVKIKFDPKTGDFCEKWILKEAARPYITEELYRRKKHRFTAPPGVKKNGPLSKVIAELVTQENVDQLGFLDWPVIEARLKRGLEGEDPSFRYCVTIAQWVVLSQRFGVAKAEPLA
ncbi:glutamine-hydrolyzing asparagine synthase [Delitschia confertaspora ATCC 74209]|uniref:Glutamine-hydrolyzing asparagine synthase n=1 Tax=Delitschia confertaspora ATCC 74209 TaxID=1513339 RepID=A0A9P4JMZ4_9PLEO|nr:glutamine-hydrolyzing asparagine synthase [Delitschia confertaspora ATCC 74209]